MDPPVQRILVVQSALVTWLRLSATTCEVRVQIEVITFAEADLDTLPSGLLSMVDAAACLGVSPAMVHPAKRWARSMSSQRTAPGRMGWRWLVPTEELRE
jgi:hypothetical protein